MKGQIAVTYRERSTVPGGSRAVVRGIYGIDGHASERTGRRPHGAVGECASFWRMGLGSRAQAAVCEQLRKIPII